MKHLVSIINLDGVFEVHEFETNLLAARFVELMEISGIRVLRVWSEAKEAV